MAGILGNAVLVRFIGELFDQRMNPYFERLSSYFEDRKTWQPALEEHRAVRDAIAAARSEASQGGHAGASAQVAGAILDAAFGEMSGKQGDREAATGHAD